VTSVAFHADQPFARVPGGIGAYVRGLVPALTAADPDLDLTLFHARFDQQPEAWMRDFPRVQLRHRIRTLYPSWALLGRPALPDPLGRADIVHAPLPSAVPPVGRRQRLVVTVHDLAFRLYPAMYPPPWRALYGLGLRRAIRHADMLLTCSSHTADDLTRAGVPPRRIHVTWSAPSLPVGSDDAAAALDRLRIPRPYVLFVGTLEPRKNVPRLIGAYRKVVGDYGLPHALVLAGPRGWRAEAVDRELALPGPGRIVRTGRVDPADLDALYRGADLFCYPSLYEGFGLPVVEAMARGIPVVCSNTSSLPEVAGPAAVQVDPTSVEELAGAISAVLGDGGERARMADAGPTQAATFSWERTAGETLQAYREAA
jgi:glycosyltransferase involved in cell wall biosynthesis